MKKNLWVRLLITGMLLVLANLMVHSVGEPQAEAKKSLHTHSHGAAEINVSIEGSSVEIEIHAPNLDVLGFENAPSSELERNTVKQVRQLLEKDFEPVVFPKEAQCKLMGKKVEFDFPKKDGEDHSDLEMELNYSCLNILKIKTVETTLFKKFPTLQNAKVQIVNGDKQSSEKVTPKKVIFKINDL